MSDKDTDETPAEEESTEVRDLAEYHCVLGVQERADPRAGQVTEAVFDMDVLEEWVYRELLDVIEAEGYEFVAFASTTEEDVATMGLPEDAVGNPKGAWTYRGTGGGE
jgi:hypothetical protein